MATAHEYLIVNAGEKIYAIPQEELKRFLVTGEKRTKVEQAMGSDVSGFAMGAFNATEDSAAYKANAAKVDSTASKAHHSKFSGDVTTSAVTVVSAFLTVPTVF